MENPCIRLYADKAQISACRSKIKLAQTSFTQLSRILDLAANETRLKIICLLEVEKELCPCDLSDILGMTIPAISQHLRKLNDGGIVERRKDGQIIHYSLSQSNLKILKPFFKHINQKTEKFQTA
jgi:DNA-binding transcriptional ArsR family regulator